MVILAGWGWPVGLAQWSAHPEEAHPPERGTLRSSYVGTSRGHILSVRLRTKTDEARSRVPVCKSHEQERKIVITIRPSPRHKQRTKEVPPKGNCAPLAGTVHDAVIATIFRVCGSAYTKPSIRGVIM